MFTPQEVREQSESFEKAVFGGYSVSAVDDFIAPLAEDYAALYKENAVLKSKMKVLVERLEKYRTQEESLNKAMVAAQKTADEMIEETERKCAKMLSDTEGSLRDRNVDLKPGAGCGGRACFQSQKNGGGLYCGDGKSGASVPEPAGADPADDHRAKGSKGSKGGSAEARGGIHPKAGAGKGGSR